MTLKKWKIYIAEIFFIVLFIVIGINIYFLQVGNGVAGRNVVADENYKIQDKIENRKLIYFTDKFSNKIPVVLNKKFPNIYVSPKEIKIGDEERYANLLSPIVGIDRKVLLKHFLNKKSQYYLLIKKADSSVVSKIKNLRLSGVYIKNYFYRYYPYGEMASRLLGFVGSASNGTFKGRYGVEREFDSWLSGKTNILPDNGNTVYNKDGLYLTIDRNIESEAKKIITKLVKDTKADGGTIIVQNPNTGEILAMESCPSFNPNNYSEYLINDFTNPAVEYMYEPGSVFKPITMSAGIDSGAITPNTTYFDNGIVTINGREIRNWDLKAHGIQTITNVLEKSLNIGAIFAEKRTGHKVFTQYVKKFGFGEKTGILLPGELSGDISPLKNGRDINYATASFGQGVAVTPIQMISAFSAIANGGVLMRPLIVKDEKRVVIRRVIKEDTAKKVTNMLVSAVDKNYVAVIKNYKITGKTGTAFIPDFVHGGYTHDVKNTYIGYAPASDPKFVILVKLDKPKGAPLAGRTVVPAFRKLAIFILNYYDILPDRIE